MLVDAPDVRAAVYVLLLAPLLLGGAKAPEPPEVRGTWIAARTENFVLYSNATEKQTREVARQLELFRLLLGRIATRIRLTSPAPTTLLVFDGDKSFAPYRNDADERGLFMHRTDGNFAAFIARPYIAPSARNLDQSAHFPYDTVYHEYVHYVLRNNFPNVPRWLHEGMAQYYATFRMAGETAQFGFPRSVHLNNVKHGTWIPLEDLLRDGPASRHDLLTGMFYCQSWFATHYILSGDANRLRQLDAYLRLLEKGTPSDRAFFDAFQTDADGFSGELRRYLAANQFYMASTVLEPPGPIGVGVSAMSAPEVLSHLGAWLARLGADRRADAEAHFREALRVAPAYAPAEAGLGFVFDRADCAGDAEAAYVRALATDPESYAARFHYAWHLVARAARAPPNTEPGVRDGWLEQARGYFAGCVRDHPGYAEAHFGLGLTFLYRSEPSSEGQASIERAWKALPSRADIAYHAIRLAQATGKDDRAREILEIVIRRFPGLLLEYVVLPTEWEWHPQYAVPPSQPSAVAALLAGSLAQVSDPEIRAGLEEWTKRAIRSAP